MYTLLPLTRHGLRDPTLLTSHVSHHHGTLNQGFRKPSVSAMADRFRVRPPRGVHALPVPPRRVSVLQMKASASPLALHLASSLSAIAFLRERSDQEAVTAAKPNPTQLSAIVQFS